MPEDVRAARHGELRFRPTRDSDLDFVLAAESAPEHRLFVSQWNRADHAAACRDPDRVHWIVEECDPAVPVAYVILAGLASPHRSIELLRMVVTAKGRGIGRSVLRRVAAFAFEERAAHRLWLDVFTDNERARSLYASEGFVEEGVLRECLLRDGVYRSLRVMSLLEGEWWARG